MNSFREAPFATSFLRKAQSGDYLRICRKPETSEWCVVYMANGKRNEEKTYYTDDKQDAIDTADHMSKSHGIPIKGLEKKGQAISQLSDLPKSFPRWDINKEGKFNPSEFKGELSKMLQDRFKTESGAANGMAQAALEVLEKQGVLNKSASTERWQG
jgi:hypothetical protein